MKSRKIVGTLFGLVAIGGAVAWAGIALLDNKEEVEAQVYRRSTDLKPLVSTFKVRQQSLEVTQTYLGTFQPNREIDLLAETHGKVIYVGIERGQAIERGHLIARLDNDMTQAQLIAARAAHEKALADVARYEDAVRNEAMPKINLENARLALKSAESQLRTLEKQLSFTEIRAPFSGVVTYKMFEVGSVLSPGAPLIKLTDISKLKLTVNIPEKEVNFLRVGQTLPIRTEVYPDLTLQGSISFIAPQGDAAHNFETELVIDNPRDAQLRAGMYGRTSLTKSRAETLLIPRVALIGSAKNPQVYVVEQDTAQLVDVQLGATHGELVELRAGLQEGDEVVTVGQINLSHQAAVKVVESNNSNYLLSKQ